ncbi:MAG: amidohydrolase family protein [Deferribacterales bacterium]
MKRKAFYADYIYYEGELHKDKYLLVTGDKIHGIVNHADEEGASGYEVEYFHNSAIFPGLVNTHTHLPMTLFRGMADDLALMDWLQNHIWPAETKWLSEEFVLNATELAAIEMIKSGTTTSCDMYFISDIIASSIAKAGMKAVIGAGILDFPTKFGKGPDDYIAKAADLYLKYQDNKLIDISLCPHAPYTVSPDTYIKCVEFCGKHDILLHTHLAEASNERPDAIEKYGKSTVQIMDEVGAFDLDKSIFAHCVHLTDDEIDLMGKKKVNVALNIQSNMKLANGFAPAQKMLDAGVNLTIGTDGAASNNDLDMISEMQTQALVHKGVQMDATAFPAETVLKMGTVNGANGLGIRKTGELKRGNLADFIVVSYDAPHMTPVYDPISHLIYSAKSTDVTHTYVNGQCLMKDRKVLTLDEEQVKEDARRWAQKIKENK